MEIQKAKLWSIYHTTEDILLNSQEDTTAELLRYFCDSTNSNYTPSISLKTKINREENPPTPSPPPQDRTIEDTTPQTLALSTSRKRPTTRTHPDSKKVSKRYNPFLDQGQCYNHPI